MGWVCKKNLQKYPRVRGVYISALKNGCCIQRYLSVVFMSGYGWELKSTSQQNLTKHTFTNDNKSYCFSLPTLLTPPICQRHPSFISGLLGLASSQSSWHTLNQNGSSLPWNGCLAARMLSPRNALVRKVYHQRGRLACCVRLASHVSLCVLS